MAIKKTKVDTNCEKKKSNSSSSSSKIIKPTVKYSEVRRKVSAAPKQGTVSRTLAKKVIREVISSRKKSK